MEHFQFVMNILSLQSLLKRLSRSAFWACKLRRNWDLRSSGILRGVCW